MRHVEEYSGMGTECAKAWRVRGHASRIWLSMSGAGALHGETRLWKWAGPSKKGLAYLAMAYIFINIEMHEIHPEKCIRHKCI